MKKNRSSILPQVLAQSSSQGLNMRSSGMEKSVLNAPPRQQDRSKTLGANGLQKADWELALKRTNRKKNQFYKGKQVSLFVDLDHFKVYGTGIYLFFSFLKGLVVIFLLLAIILTVPCVINYLEGNGLRNVTTSLNYYFAKTSIGNYISSRDSKSSFHKIMNVIPCMAAIGVFIIYYFVWLYRSDKLAVEVRKQIKLKSYNALQLINPPSEAREQDIAKFMSQFGKVTEIAAVNNYSQTIDLSKEIYKKEIKVRELQMKAQSENTKQYDAEILQKKKDIEELYKELVLYQDEIKGQVIKYYISFSSMEQRQKALKQLEPHLQASCDCFRESTPQRYLLLGQRVNVVACHTEPGQIIWQNQHITWKSRWIRSIIQFVVLLALISSGFIFIQFLNLLTPATTTVSLDTSSYTSTSILSQSNATIVQSWCLTNAQTVIQDTESSLYNKCFTYIKEYYMKVLISVGIAISIVVIKQLLKIFVIKIAKFQRYTTYTEQSKDIIQNLFLTYTCTTILITLLMQANLLGLSFKNVLTSLVNIGSLTKNSATLNQYADFVSTWYLDIGYQICINWVIMTVHPFLTMPFVLFLSEKLKYCSASSEQIQTNMQAKLEPAQFQLEDHYANILMIAVVSLAFAPGMPAIIIVGFLALLSRYIYCKYIFIRHCKVPKTFDESLDAKMTKILPYGIFFFFAFGVWMFGVEQIFRREANIAGQWAKQNLRYPILKQIKFIMERLIATWYFSAMFLVTIVVFAFKIFFYNLILSNCVQDTKESVQMKIAPSVEGQSVEEDMMPISAKDLYNSYKIENNPDYRQILQIQQAKSKFVVRAVVKNK